METVIITRAGRRRTIHNNYIHIQIRQVDSCTVGAGNINIFKFYTTIDIHTDTVFGKRTRCVISDHSVAVYINIGVGHGAKEVGFGDTHDIYIVVMDELVNMGEFPCQTINI